MLTKMYLTNFLTFTERTEFDFVSSKYSILSQTNVSNDDVLKGALIIGPNASGKSNALRGIGLIIQMLKGTGVSMSNYRCYFGKDPLTVVEYEFLIGGKSVLYKISYNVAEKNLIENLFIDGDSILYRNGSYGELKIDGKRSTEDKLDGETLFLRTASFNTGRFPDEPTLRCLMDFLLNSYYIDGYNNSAIFAQTLTKYAEEFGVEKINKYLNDFNYDFFVEYGNESYGEGLKIHLESDKKSVFFKRKSFPIPNTIYRESQGNQVFADMLPSFINTIESPGILVIDEFGNSFHNKLSEKIIRFFMDKSKKSQFFVTSHASNLISNSVFRPDQIFLITFEGANGSKIKRISQFKPREAQNLEKMYLGGMFEGLPAYEENL